MEENVKSRICIDPEYSSDCFAITEKKVEPKRLHPGAFLENGATLEGGAVFLHDASPSNNI